jgi:acetyltransferase-like isoleucine patch superfamily enzyme
MKMVNFITNIYRKFRLAKVSKSIQNRVTLIDGGHRFHHNSRVELKSGSNSSCIQLGSNTWMYGVLRSSNGGKIIFGEYTRIGSGSEVLCVNNIVIGNYTTISNNVTIVDNNNHPLNPEDRLFMRTLPEDSIYRDWRYSENSPIVIGENVWVGINSRINKGVTIGDNAIVAANAVVTKDVPANSVVAGNPGKIVKTNLNDVPRVFENIDER